jgi:hypothetical protein
MVTSRVFRVSCEQLLKWFGESSERMELRSLIGEHFLWQIKGRYLDFFRATPRQRYEMLLQRCPGIVHLLDLQDIASFLCITPQMLSKIRKGITFETKQ